MKFKTTYEFEILFVRCLVFAVACVLCFVALSGCNSSKKVNKVLTEETRVLTVDSAAKVTSDSTKLKVEEKIKTSDNTVEFYPAYPTELRNVPGKDLISYPCDTIYVPKIRYFPDGSFEATGVRRVNLKLTEWEKKYDSLNIEYNLEINRRMTLEQELKSKTVVKDKETKPVFLGWLLFLVIGFVTGYYAKHKLK